ncbi:MAG: diguanylate cyclase, partial [Pseudomonadota bacterium]
MTTVLVVEDDDVDAERVRRALSSDEHVGRVLRACNVRQAREQLRGEQVDALIVDLTLPDAEPARTLPALLAGHEALPVVVLTGCLDDEFASAAIASGVQDYLVKDEAGDGAVRRALRFALARAQRNAKISALAARDCLTGVANRQAFEKRLSDYFASNPDDNMLLALALIDVDEFKALNDERGHVFGDSVLRAVADLLVANVRRSDTVARIGGDEFVVVIFDP